MNRHGDMEPMIWDYPGEPDRPEPIEPEMHKFKVSMYVDGCVEFELEAEDEDNAIDEAERVWFNNDDSTLIENLSLLDINNLIVDQLDVDTRTYRSKEVD